MIKKVAKTSKSTLKTITFYNPYIKVMFDEA